MTPCVPLKPRGADGVLRVILPGRVSTPGQDLENIPARQADAEAWVRNSYAGPLQTHRLGDQASGWAAGRESMAEALALVESGAWDAVVATELRDVFRNPAFLWAFVQTCVDAKVRFVAIYDRVDTADDGWEVMMHTATLRHGMDVPQARRRVRLKATHSFSRGGMVLKVRFGYRKLTKEEADGGAFGPPGLRLARLPERTPVLHEMRRRVLRGDSYESVADWLHEEGIPLGPYAGGARWTGKLVKELLLDPVLSGRRTFRAQLHTLVYATGKHRAEKNPHGPEVKEYAELAHFSAAEHQELLAVMEARRRSRSTKGGEGRAGALRGRPRRRSPWPGQHPRCGVCGALMYRFGKYQKCKNALPGGPRSCWNRVQVDFARARRQVLAWVRGVLEAHPAYRDRAADVAWEEFRRQQRRRRSSSAGLDGRVEELSAQARNLAQGVRLGGRIEALVAELAEVNGRLQAARQEQRRLAEADRAAGAFLARGDVEARLGEALEGLAAGSLEFADLLRRLLPRYVIRPVKGLRTNQVRPRAELTLDLAPWSDGDVTPLPVSTTLDLFDPPGYIAELPRVVAAHRADPAATLRQLAARLGVNYMTVKHALDYARRMEAAGLTDPFQPLAGPPAGPSRWQRRRPPPGPAQSA